MTDPVAMTAKTAMPNIEPATDMIYEVEAYNTAHASENKIHDDVVASQFGFAGGLVPGVDVFAYLTHLPVGRWGRRFLECGQISARFARPVYDGEMARVQAVLDGAEMQLTLTSGEGSSAQQECAIGSASLIANPDALLWPSLGVNDLPHPEDRLPASEESLSEGQVLGTLRETFQSTDLEIYLEEVREVLPLYREDQLCHPGYLLRRANTILKDTVELGPWIHVSSEASYLSTLQVGESFETRAEVRKNYEHKGHRFVELEVAILGPDQRPIMQAVHTAIYEPRQVREKSTT